MKGTIVKFDSGRRFGFIRVSTDQDDIFFHESGVVSGHNDIAPGATVTFDQAHGDKGPKAVNIAVTRGAPASPYSFFTGAACALTALVYAALVIYTACPRGYAYLIGINVALFCLCAFDKSSAAFAANRVPEKVMYLFAALGGSLGLILGMKLFRHKTQKSSLQFFLLVIVATQVALLHFAGLLPGRH